MTQDDLTQLFGQYGEVTDAFIPNGEASPAVPLPTQPSPPQ
jgi:hypothetical protein